MFEGPQGSPEPGIGLTAQLPPPPFALWPLRRQYNKVRIFAPSSLPPRLVLDLSCVTKAAELAELVMLDDRAGGRIGAAGPGPFPPHLVCCQKAGG